MWIARTPKVLSNQRSGILTQFLSRRRACPQGNPHAADHCNGLLERIAVRAQPVMITLRESPRNATRLECDPCRFRPRLQWQPMSLSVRLLRNRTSGDGLSLENHVTSDRSCWTRGGTAKRRCPNSLKSRNRFNARISDPESRTTAGTSPRNPGGSKRFIPSPEDI